MRIAKVIPPSLLQHIRYEDCSGLFYWAISPSPHIKCGTVAGNINAQGYHSIYFRGKNYKAHRIAWAISHGSISPTEEIDHINGNRSDNKIRNLRIATCSQQNANSSKRSDNTSGYRGVTWAHYTNRWRSEISSNGKRKHLGYFNRAENAALAYEFASLAIRGEFHRKIGA